MFGSYQVNMFGIHHILTLRVHTKHISDLVLVKYISEPIFCLYKVASIVSNVSSFNKFKFVVIGVVMALQSGIPNLFIISTVYFPRFRKISSGNYQTSRPKK